MMKKQKGFTLIETLLSTTIVAVLFSACVFNFDSLWNNKTNINAKVEEYITLNRYVKYNSQLIGKKATVVVETNKLKVITIDYQGIVDSISTIQYQIDELNKNINFESKSSNVMTYFPDGSMESEGTVGMRVEDEEIWVTIGEWNRVEINNTNRVCIEDEF